MYEGQPCDPATHVFCARLAWALVQRIQSVLRPEEINDCARQFYLDIRVHLEHEKRFKLNRRDQDIER
jgi:hypothetical protein